MPDHTAPEPAEPVTEPAHPKPAATARTVAAGVLFAALGAVVAATTVVLITAFRLVGNGDVRLDFGGPPAVLLAVAFAAVNVAALLLLTHEWAPPRAVTAVLAFVVAVAWPLSDIRLPAAALAIVAIGLAIGRDRRVGGGRRVTGWSAFGALAAAGVGLAIVGAALANTHPASHPRAAVPKTPSEATGGVASGDVAPPAEVAPSEPAREATPAATASAPAEEAPTGEAPSEAGGEAPTVAAEEAPAGEAPTGAAGEAPGGLAPTVAAEEAAGEAPSGAAGEAPAVEAPTDAALPESPELPSTGLPDAGSQGAPLAEAPAGSLDDAAPAAESFVRAYYRALDEKRFEDAWDSLTPALRTRFGGFAGWKAGYATTVYSKPRNIAVTATGNGATVEHLLVARDKNCAGERRFSVTWRLRRVSEQWSVTALTAAAVGADTARCR